MGEQTAATANGGPGGTDEPVVDLLADAFSSVDELIDGLDDAAFATPSPLQGWTVKDCLSHILGTELSLLGDPAPVVEISHLEHVTTPFQEFLEVWIEERRPRSGDEVRVEFRATVPRRLAQLRSMAPEEFDEVSFSPIGEVPYRDFMGVRVFDTWMHEQDMRRALGRPGHETGPVVDSALGNIRRALGFIVGKKAAAPDGASVVFATTGGNEVTIAVVVDGRATVVDEVPVDPTVRLTMPFATFIALAGGRIDADAGEAEGLVYEGDTDLGRRVAEHLGFTP